MTTVNAQHRLLFGGGMAVPSGTGLTDTEEGLGLDRTGGGFYMAYEYQMNERWSVNAEFSWAKWSSDTTDLANTANSIRYGLGTQYILNPDAIYFEYSLGLHLGASTNGKDIRDLGNNRLMLEP